VLDVSPAGALTHKLTAAREAGGLRLRATGGVFDEGTLGLRWLDMHGAAIAGTALGAVSPLRPVTLHHLEKPPQGSRTVELTVTLPSGETRLWASIVLEEGEEP
jgi:hypothetical protein